MDDINQVLGRLRGRLAVVGHVITDVILHQLGHETVGGAPGGSQTLKNVGARHIVVESAQDGFQLADDFLGPVYQIELFA